MKYLIYGLGLSGFAAVRYFLNSGQKIIVTDDNDSTIENAKIKLSTDISDKNIEFIKSSEIDLHLSKDDVVIFSPGIPLYYPKPHKILEIIKKTQAKLLCDIELFYLLNKNKTFFGITGTNGKSTTTALIGFILDQLKIDAKIGGNIGKPCFELEQANNYVFEVSSYQIDLCNEVHFHVASLTNITPDHIDRHGSFENYIAIKKRIFCNQKKDDYSIIGIDNEFSFAVYNELKSDKNFHSNIIAVSTRNICDNGVAVINNILYNKIDNANSEISLEGLFLKGEHNMQNIAIAFANVFCALKNKIPTKNLENAIIAAIKKFKGLKHRMQFIGNINDINFINDSKATNAESTENALKSYENIFWILGGKAKDGGIKILKPYFNKIIKSYLIGEATEEFAKFLYENNVKFEKCGNLQNAVNLAFLDAKKSGLKEKNILLSPACASFDQWKNFEERGEYFCKVFDEINQNRENITNT